MKSKGSQLKIGIILNYLNMGLGSLIPILYTPIMLQLLGQDEYGLYKLASSLTSYLNLLSLGLGAAVTRYLIKAREEEGKEAEERVLGLFQIIFFIIAIVSFLAGILLTSFLHIWYGNSLCAEELFRMRIIVFVFSCNTAISFAVSPYMAVVSTHEKFLFQQIVNIITTCALPLFNIIILFIGFKSVGMAVLSLIMSLIGQIAYLIYIRVFLRIRACYKGMPTKMLKEILVFSFWIFVSNIVNQLQSATDTVMIGAIPALATTGVAVYNVGATFYSMTLTLTIGVSSLLAPKTNKMVFSGASKKELTDYAIRIGRIQGYMVTLIVSGFIAFGRPFIELYAGKEYQESYWVAAFIMVPSVIPLVQSVCYNVIVAENKHKFRSLVYLCTTIANVIGTWFMMKVIGVVGAALMTGITSFIGTGLIINWYYAKRIHLEMKRFWGELGKLYVIPCILCIITLFLAKRIDFYHIDMLVGGIIVYTVLYCIFEWIFVLNSYEKTLFMEPIQKTVGRFRNKKNI